MARVYDYNVPRTQDYLLGGVGEQRNEPNQPSAPRISYATGGTGTVFGGAKRQTPDLSRTAFKARERQITENAPKQLDLSFLNTEINRALADVREQGTKQLDVLAKAGGKLSDYLPDLSKAVLSSDEQAMQTVAQRLAAPTQQYTTENVSTAYDDALLNYLRGANKETFQDALIKQRGGGGLLGMNRLDAAILARSGQAREALNKKRREVESIAGTEGMYNRTIAGEKAAAEKRYADTTKQIKDYLQQQAKATEGDIERTVQQYKDRDMRVAKELAKAETIERLRRENPEVLPFIGGATDIERFIDREMTREEATSAKQAEILNNVAKLLGTGQIYGTRAQEALYDQNALLNYLREFGQRGLTAEQAAIKARQEQIAEAQRKAEAQRIREEEKIRAEEVFVPRAVQNNKTIDKYRSPYLPKQSSPVIADKANKTTGGRIIQAGAKALAKLFGR